MSAELVRRAYRFERGEARALTAADLARQRSAAGYLGTRCQELGPDDPPDVMS